MSTQPSPDQNEYITPEEYLERERKADFRSDYRGNGAVVAMAGASRTRNRITFNIAGQLYRHLCGGPCEASVNDMKVRLPGTLRYVYPDVVVSRGEEDFQDEREDILTNPTLIVEVFSDPTQSYDRGEKWEGYQRILSLREYVLVSRNRAVVERFLRQGGLWLYSLTAGVDAAITLESIGASLRLAEIYEGVTLSTPSEPA